MSYNRCPLCGGELVEKKVEKLLRGGNHTAVVDVKAEVCTHCGERIYSKETIKLFENIRFKLAKQDLAGFEAVGKSFKVAG